MLRAVFIIYKGPGVEVVGSGDLDVYTAADCSCCKCVPDIVDVDDRGILAIVREHTPCLLTGK